MRDTIKDSRDKNMKNNTTFIKWQFLGKTIKVWQGKITNSNVIKKD